MIQALYTKEMFKNFPEDFRIGAILSDGMWYDIAKIKKYSKVSEENIKLWLDKEVASGRLIKYDNQDNDKPSSYRYPLTSIMEWYRENNIDFDPSMQVVDFLFSPRVWDGKTETEGFLEAPRREVGIVTFICNADVADEVKEKLRGRARVRETDPNVYKAYSLDSVTTRKIVDEVFKCHQPSEYEKHHSRSMSMRRELMDFSPEFKEGLVNFYRNFGRSLVRGSMDTIRIFLEDKEDQDVQITLWIIEAIEKFDETKSIPFAAYLSNILRCWPYNLPKQLLGEELSEFIKKRKKAIERLSKKTGRTSFTAVEIYQEMGVDQKFFERLEETHKIWANSMKASAFTWGDSADEKISVGLVHEYHGSSSVASDIDLAHKMSVAIVNSAVKTECFKDAYNIISQVDIEAFDMKKIKDTKPEFIQKLGEELGLS